MYYAKTTGGFYPEQYPGGPTDLVEIPYEYYLTLLAGEAAGKVIVGDAEGYPILQDAPQLPPQVPQKVTMRQARLALHNAGKLVDVEFAINALPEPPRTAARIEWDFSSEVHRDKEFVAMMGTALGLSDAQLDDLFVQAALL